MRDLGFLLSHLSSILLLSLLAPSTQLLWAQGKPPPLDEVPVQLFDVPSRLAPGSKAQIHLPFASRRLPLSFRQNQGQAESWMRSSPPYNAGDFRLLVHTESVLSQAARMAELPEKKKYFMGSAPSMRLTFVPAHGKVHFETSNRINEVEYYAHHIPWAGSFVLRICQQAKAHPHITTVLNALQPKF
ncbi:MAG TPA: hypothetical protein VKT33_14065 [Candidatus Angelobacter sp.]|nr:hypothetical protein [Candidatus Angelobacter sp.]